MRSSRSRFPKSNATVPFPADDNCSVLLCHSLPRARSEEPRAPGSLKAVGAASGAASPGKGLLLAHYSPRPGGRAPGPRQRRGAGRRRARRAPGRRRAPGPRPGPERVAAGVCRRAWPWPGCSAGGGRRCAGARAPGARAIRPRNGPRRCCGGAGTARCACGGAP